jgi:hypothetical protein
MKTPINLRAPRLKPSDEDRGRYNAERKEHQTKQKDKPAKESSRRRRRPAAWEKIQEFS